jgi:hypothetical protein
VFKKSIAIILIGTTALNSLMWVPRALADQESRPISRPTFAFSFDVPYHGALDAYHNAYMSRDRISNSLYALRNTAVEDLLNTRRALKALIGGTARLHAMPGGKDLGFEVPGGVTNLYLLGDLQTTARPSRSESSDFADTISSHGIDQNTLPEIADTIRWIATQEPDYNEALRTRLLLGLAYVSAQLTKFDQQLKFIETDFWKDPDIAYQYHREEIQPVLQAQTQGAAAGGGSAPSDLTNSHRQQIKRNWYERHQMIDVVSALAGHREYLMDRYHLLGVEINGKPLYQVLYAAMEKQGFPSAGLKQPVSEHRLPGGSDPIPLPDVFEKAVNAAFDRNTAADSQGNFLSELYRVGNPRIDDALLQSLRANSDRLEALTSEIHYDGSRSSKLLELARYEDLWAATLDKYGYLSGIIDLQGGHDEIASYFKRRDKTAKHVKWVVYGVGIGIGIAATVFSFGTAAEAGALLGVPLRAWLIGSATITSGQAYIDYVDSSESAKVAQGLFLGTAHVGSYSEMTGALELKKQDFHFLLASLIMLGVEARVLSLLAKARPIIVAGGRMVVRLTKEELKILRQAVINVTQRAEIMAPMGRALISAVRNLSQLATGGVDVFMGAEAAIPMLARELKVAPSVILAKLESNAVVGNLFKGARLRNEVSKIMARPSFFRTLLQQQAISMSVGIVTEAAARGKAMFGDELPDFLNDMAQGALVTFALVYIGSPTVAAGHAAEVAAARERIGMGPARIRTEGGFFQENSFGKLMKQGGQNMIVGLAVNGTTTGVSELVQYIGDRGNPNARSGADHAKSAALNAGYGALFMGISSNLRFAGYSWLQNNISRFIKNEPTAKIVLTSASVGNNLFGGWSYVKIAKAVGVMRDGGSTSVSIPAGGAEAEELDPSITGLALEDLGGAYFRVEGDSTAADYMFDFLREGDGAGIAPIIE